MIQTIFFEPKNICTKCKECDIWNLVDSTEEELVLEWECNYCRHRKLVTYKIVEEKESDDQFMEVTE